MCDGPQVIGDIMENLSVQQIKIMHWVLQYSHVRVLAKSCENLAETPVGIGGFRILDVHEGRVGECKKPRSLVDDLHDGFF